MTLAFRAEQNLFYRLKKVVLANLRLVAPRGEDGRFVHQIGKIRSRESRSAFGDLAKLYIRRQGLFFCMNGENLFPVVNIGQVENDRSVKSSGPQKRGIKHIGPVGC